MLVESEFQSVTLGQQTWRFHDSGQGPPVILFHGFPDLPHGYARIAQKLNDSGFRTILPYLRGYHPDTLVAGRPYDAFHIAEDAIGLMDALNLPSAVLAGHDWGASVVWGAAALAPARVRAIVPIAIPHPKTLTPKGALQIAGALVMWRHFLFFKTPWADAVTRRNDFAYIDALYRRWSPDWHGAERDACLARAKEAFRDPKVLRGAIDYYRDLSADVDPRVLRPLQTTGLLVTGANDFGGHLGPYKKSLGLLDANAELLIVPDAGHWPHREGEDLFVPKLLEFLSKLS
ncbi:MAG: alpha/beta hydrolase [Polyangiales bacterium]